MKKSVQKNTKPLAANLQYPQTILSLSHIHEVNL